MGYPYYQLVPIAVLHKNPGITREQYIQLLDQVHTFSLCEFGEKTRWTPNYNSRLNKDLKLEDDNWHKGLRGLARILMLEESEKWIEFQARKRDANGLLIDAPEYYPDDRTGKVVHTVCIHERNVVEPEEEVEDESKYRLKVGDFWREHGFGGRRGFIKNILDEMSFIDPDTNQLEFYKYRLLIESHHEEKRIEKFSSEEELYKRWPQFQPEFRYNFAQTRGKFFSEHDILVSKGFAWIQKDGKYYLDLETFDRISAGSGANEFRFGYTDLILTEESIKNKAWRVLSRRGLKHLPAFLKRFPDSRKVYERAVWDSHTSLSAKLQGMTNTEFLRYRLLPTDALD